ncbi:hypothetical protein QQF64_003046 [Cirrhinus molitorella]|uniref:Secreted protein n=1 Tax=Cirrhinus molitorella TaxID=172907 RepID=A0ABR3MKP6_9TELE
MCVALSKGPLALLFGFGEMFRATGKSCQTACGELQALAHVCLFHLCPSCPLHRSALSFGVQLVRAEPEPVFNFRLSPLHLISLTGGDLPPSILALPANGIVKEASPHPCGLLGCMC